MGHHEQILGKGEKFGDKARLGATGELICAYSQSKRQ